MNIILDVQQHEETGACMFWQGYPISRCRSLAMRRGWEQAREDFERESREERALWAAEAARTAVRS